MVCPKVLASLPIPRNLAEIIGGNGEDVWCGRARVIENTGADCHRGI
ncbi:hypothetical protein [Vagococcus hydrophili]|uniref:Uncharacterized protein n=1 Tax=Vagococcus hydrophili TaxID=2714947 RepID=A0A6G8AU21_9ENTE|nr:hypothetical protein [Vagococcus hydrophili]QIL48581.1 hypothetical protein G7082_08740 [Vagococcus hydrophili]